MSARMRPAREVVLEERTRRDGARALDARNTRGEGARTRNQAMRFEVRTAERRAEDALEECRRLRSDLDRSEERRETIQRALQRSERAKEELERENERLRAERDELREKLEDASKKRKKPRETDRAEKRESEKPKTFD